MRLQHPYWFGLGAGALGAAAGWMLGGAYLDGAITGFGGLVLVLGSLRRTA